MWSIREALAMVYLFIKKPTIFSWLQKQIFRPEVYFPPPNGPGRQSLLSKADIVTIGILSCLFSLNIRFGQLHLTPEVETPDTQIWFQSKIHQESGPDMISSNIANNMGPDRSIQHFLEENDFQVMCAVYRIRLFLHNWKGVREDANPLNSILTRIFFFTPNLLHEKHNCHINESEPAETVSFINIQGIVKHVEWALKL
jgi:hypothetical protein